MALPLRVTTAALAPGDPEKAGGVKSLECRRHRPLIRMRRS